MKKTVFIGNSLSQCTNSIMQGLRSIDDVLCIVAGTRAPTHEAIFDNYWRSIWSTKYSDRKDELRAVVETLWGRSVQPRDFGIEPHIVNQPTWIELDLDPNQPALEVAELVELAKVNVENSVSELLIGLDVAEAVEGIFSSIVRLGDVACIISDTPCSCAELFEVCWQKSWRYRFYTIMPREQLYEYFRLNIWPRVVQPRLTGFEFSLEGQPSTWIKANMAQTIY